MTVRLLALADIHLGRRAAGIPEEVEAELDPRRLGPAEAWKRAVEYAIQERVDAVTLSGDVVDDEEDFYEAFHRLHEGAKELSEAGIPVYTVAGNHDLNVLPRLAKTLPAVRLLGCGGHWEEVPLRGRSGTEIRLRGWSFPSAKVLGDPLDKFPPVGAGPPVVGLLHCDRDGSASAYAPVPSSRLREAEVAAWLLGHIHKPDPLDRDPRGYLGSLAALDPSESGPHGAWLVEVSPQGAAATLLPLSPLRWEHVELDVSSLEDPDHLDRVLIDRMRELDEELAGGIHPPPLAVGLRVRLFGRTRFRSELRSKIDEAQAAKYPGASTLYFIEGFRFDALPALDLERLSQVKDPPGILARKLIELRTGGPGARALLKEVQAELESVLRSSPFTPLASEGLEDEEFRRLLEEAALLALDALLEEKETRP